MIAIHLFLPIQIYAYKYTHTDKFIRIYKIIENKPSPKIYRIKIILVDLVQELILSETCLTIIAKCTFLLGPIRVNQKIRTQFAFRTLGKIILCRNSK